MLAAGIGGYLCLLFMRFRNATKTIRERLSVERILEKRRSYAGDTCKVLLTTASIGNPHIRIDALEDIRKFSGVQERAVLPVAHFGPGGAASAEYLLRFSSAGVIQFEDVLVRFVDERGLFTSCSTLQLPARLEVEVPPYRGRALISPMQFYGGSPNRRGISPTGAEYASTRTYVPGDELRRIEWKASARLQKLMMKQFHTETMGTVVAILDGRASMSEKGFVASRFEEGLAVARLMAQTTLEVGGAFGFGIMREHKLAEYWLPEPRRSRLEELRKLAIQLRPPSSEHITAIPREPITRRSISTQIENIEKSEAGSRAVALFLQLLKNARALLTERFRRSGASGAVRFFSDSLAHPAFMLVLTDLQGQQDELLEGLKYAIGRGHKPVVVQVAAAWRLIPDLEQAYAVYDVNLRVIKRFREEGAQVLDIKPQELVGAVIREVTQETR